MIDLLGFLYTLAKDAKAYWEWREETKLVDYQWLELSGFGAKAKEAGLELRWSAPHKVQSRLLQGYEIIYEVDKANRIRRRLELKDGPVLMGKRVDP